MDTDRFEKLCEGYSDENRQLMLQLVNEYLGGLERRIEEFGLDDESATRWCNLKRMKSVLTGEGQ